MLSDKDILQQFADRIVPELKAVAKGFAPSIEAVVDDTSMTIYASPYIMTLVHGRGPTKASGWSSGPKTLQQVILAWIEKHSIQPRASKDGRIPTAEQLSWMISKTIHRDGTLLYRRGGGNNVFDTIITSNRMENLLNLFGEKYLTEIKAINLK